MSICRNLKFILLSLFTAFSYARAAECPMKYSEAAAAAEGRYLSESGIELDITTHQCLSFQGNIDDAKQGARFKIQIQASLLRTSDTSSITLMENSYEIVGFPSPFGLIFVPVGDLFFSSSSDGKKVAELEPPMFKYPGSISIEFSDGTTQKFTKESKK